MKVVPEIVFTAPLLIVSGPQSTAVQEKDDIDTLLQSTTTYLYKLVQAPTSY